MGGCGTITCGDENDGRGSDTPAGRFVAGSTGRPRPADPGLRSSPYRQDGPAWCANPVNRPVDTGVVDVVGSAVRKLAACGHSASRVELDLGGWEENFGPIVLAEEGKRRGHLLDGPHRLTRYQELSLRTAERLEAVLEVRPFARLPSRVSAL